MRAVGHLAVGRVAFIKNTSMIPTSFQPGGNTKRPLSPQMCCEHTKQGPCFLETPAREQARTRASRYARLQRGLPTPACVRLDPITFPSAPRSDVIQSGDDDKQPVTRRCQMRDGASGWLLPK